MSKVRAVKIDLDAPSTTARNLIGCHNLPSRPGAHADPSLSCQASLAESLAIGPGNLDGEALEVCHVSGDAGNRLPPNAAHSHLRASCHRVS